MVIKILGAGCSNCKKLEENARKALAESGLPGEVQKVEDLQEIMAYGVMSTPALVLDEAVVSFGKVLNPKEILKLLQK